MRTVNIADLKALSAHLKLVRNGEEVVVYDRKMPVARIVPCATKDLNEQERRLTSRGVLLPPSRIRRRRSRWPMPPGHISEDVLEKIRREEREDR
jgi:antitoxin (DNA-binding transcriptional repressor) of toxin-antitoxin stability system